MLNLQEPKVLLFGELLWRISLPLASEGRESSPVSMTPGGSEANVAAALSLWGQPCRYMTVVPDNELADEAVHALDQRGADTRFITRKGSRMGLYFLLSANGLSSGDVVYDRRFSSFYDLQPGDIDWDLVMNECTWFHWSGIIPALSANLAAVCLEALNIARKKGLIISTDLNYRSRLWDYGKSPLQVMPELLAYSTVLMGNIWATSQMLGTSLDADLHRHTSRADYLEHASRTSQEIRLLVPACRHLLLTFRHMDHSRHNLLYCAYSDMKELYASESLESHEMTDRIGSGDACMAGFIYGLIHKLNGPEIVELANRAGFEKLFHKGDFTLAQCPSV